MRVLLNVRESLKKIYGSYSLYINKVFQFVLGLLIFWCISGSLGYWDLLSSSVVILGAALVCTFLPVNFTAFVAAVMILGHLYKLSIATLAVGAVALIILYIVYLRITPKYGFILLLTPLCCALKIPGIIPIVIGLSFTPVAVIPAGIGAFMFWFVNSTSDYATELAAIAEPEMIEVLKDYARVIFANKEMWLMISSFIVVSIIVYILRRASFNFSWFVAIVVGVLAKVLIYVIGGPYFQVEIAWGAIFIDCIASIVVAIILQLIFFTVDYRGVKKVQFEDNEYYYYVKAVPKLRSTAMDRNLRKAVEEGIYRDKNDDDAVYDYNSHEFDYDDSEYTDYDYDDADYSDGDYGYSDK